jgi:hypothetical protein
MEKNRQVLQKGGPGFSRFYMLRKNSGKIIFIFLLLVALFLSVAHTQVLARPPLVAVHLDGVALQFDVLPRFQQGTPMFPLRKIFEEIGYAVTWEAEAKRVVLRGSGRVVVLYPQNPLYSVNGVVYRTSSPPFIERGRLLVGMDFLQESAGIKELVWNEQEGILHLEYRNGREDNKELPHLPDGDDKKKYYVNFVEVLLPPGNRTQVGESFDIVIAAPFVKGIYSYEIRFFYNPEVIKIKDIKNPSYKLQEEFYMKRINNREGMVEYTQTWLGYLEEIPPRSHLVVIEAIAFREGAVPFLEGTLKIKLLDNKANYMPVALEEKTLYTGSPR